MNIPFLDLPLQNSLLASEINEKWLKALVSASFIGGEEVALFEKEFAAECKVEHCISTSSGTDALLLILLALGVKPGDEIITVPNTFIATTEAISLAGAKIVFVDVDPETYNIDVGKIEQAITSKTIGILPVHLYGQVADVDSIIAIADKHNLWVVEDSCQAHLAEYKGRVAGGLGNAAAFSFYPGKNLGACGDAGAVTTNDPELAVKVKMLRDHGQAQKYVHAIEGINGRCDAIQASALRVKLPHLQGWNQKRREYADLYCKLLTDAPLVLPAVHESCLHVYHLFIVLVENRDTVQKQLLENGIHAGLHYPVPLHLQTAYAALGYAEGDFPVTEECSGKLLSLPLYPELTVEKIHYICECLLEILKN